MFSDIKIEKKITVIWLLFFGGRMQMLRKYQYVTRFLLVKKTKFFIGYLYNDNKASAYIKSYDGQTKWMYFLIEDDDLLEKYNTIWDKVSADIKKEFDDQLVYNKKFLKTKIKSHGDEVTDFYGKRLPKLYSNHTCLAVINLDSTLKEDDSYYPQVFLKECKYIEQKKLGVSMII